MYEQGRAYLNENLSDAKLNINSCGEKFHYAGELCWSNPQ
ncbi:protein of unknown function [Rhodovastum atsumiense]|nr:protein of unknown function [Rhodovastum atsumiense]